MSSNRFRKISIFASVVIAVIVSFSSCISITKSTFREPVARVIEAGDCQVSSSGAVFMNFFGVIKGDFMPSSVKIACKDIIIYCDPLVVEDTSKADYIFITHNHLDHFSKTDINKIIKPQTVLIAPENITNKYKHILHHSAKTGAETELKKIRFEVIASYNLKSKMHTKGDNFVGYVITCDNTRIYIAGDTDFIPEMKDLKNISVAIIPIGEGKTAMDPESASEAINLINPKVAIPVHYYLNKKREQHFLENVNKSIEVRLFQDSH